MISRTAAPTSAVLRAPHRIWSTFAEPDRHRRVRLLGGRRGGVQAVVGRRVQTAQRVDRVARGGAGDRRVRRRRPAEALPTDAIFDCRPRRDDHVVLISAPHVRALGPENADDFAGDRAQPKVFVQRVLVREELLHHGLPDQAHLVGVADVAVGERLAFGQVGPVLDIEVRRRRAGDSRGHPVAVAVDDLLAFGVHDRAGVGDCVAVREDRLAIRRLQGHRAARPRRDAAGDGLAWVDDDGVGAHAGDGFLDRRRRAVPDLHHRDHRRHADDDAQTGEDRPHDVAAKRHAGGANGTGDGVHGGGERGSGVGNQQRERFGLFASRNLPLTPGSSRRFRERRRRFQSGRLS